MFYLRLKKRKNFLNYAIKQRLKFAHIFLKFNSLRKKVRTMFRASSQTKCFGFVDLIIKPFVSLSGRWRREKEKDSS